MFFSPKLTFCVSSSAHDGQKQSRWPPKAAVWFHRLRMRFCLQGQTLGHWTKTDPSSFTEIWWNSYARLPVILYNGRLISTLWNSSVKRFLSMIWVLCWPPGVQPFPRGDHAHAGPSAEQPEGVERQEGGVWGQAGGHWGGEESQGGGSTASCSSQTRYEVVPWAQTHEIQTHRNILGY